jgi:hypothetical protein
LLSFRQGPWLKATAAVTRPKLYHYRQKEHTMSRSKLHQLADRQEKDHYDDPTTTTKAHTKNTAVVVQVLFFISLARFFFF